MSTRRGSTRSLELGYRTRSLPRGCGTVYRTRWLRQTRIQNGRPIQSIDIEAGMRRFVFFTLATVAVVAIAIAAGWRSWTDILSGPLLIGTQKVNQVTGDPAGSGITGTDLGSPVQWKNNLYFHPLPTNRARRTDEWHYSQRAARCVRNAHQRGRQ